MKLKTAIIFMLICIMITPFCANAQSISVKFGDINEHSFTVDLPSGYDTIVSEDLNRNSDYFTDLPLTKNEAIEKFNNGALLCAYASDKSGEISITSSTDSFAAEIGNLTPMSDEAKQIVVSDLKSTLEEQGHIMLYQPQLVHIGEYDFISYTARIGNTEKGYSYAAAFTVIGGNVYEITCYNAAAIPDDETVDTTEKIIKSFHLNIKGNKSQITVNGVQSFFAVAAICIAAVVALLSVISIVNSIKNRRRDETVRLRKRD